MWLLKIAFGLAAMGGGAYAAIWLYHSRPARAWRRELAVFSPETKDNWLFTVIASAVLALLCAVIVGSVLWAAYAIGEAAL